MKKLSLWLERPITEKICSIVYRLTNFSDKLFEKANRLDFDGSIPQEQIVTTYSCTLPHATWYDALSAITLRMMLREIQKTGIAFTNFIDIGSGKGKVCIYVEKLARFSKIIGVEFSQALIEIAEQNKQRSGTSKILFLHADAMEFLLPKGNNIVFMFNPFDGIVFERFISNNLLHFKENESVVAYANDYQRYILIKYGFETICRNQAPNMSLYKYRAGD